MQLICNAFELECTSITTGFKDLDNDMRNIRREVAVLLLLLLLLLLTAMNRGMAFHG